MVNFLIFLTFFESIVFSMAFNIFSSVRRQFSDSLKFFNFSVGKIDSHTIRKSTMNVMKVKKPPPPLFTIIMNLQGSRTTPHYNIRHWIERNSTSGLVVRVSLFYFSGFCSRQLPHRDSKLCFPQHVLTACLSCVSFDEFLLTCNPDGGGEAGRGNGFERLVDHWVLNTQTFQWLQIKSQMPCPLIEPCLTACHSGSIYVWGDCDEPLPGIQQHGTHLRILRVSGLEKARSTSALHR
ncbi:hypothetical protein CAEBREN_14223 [Caenorhabditis brenneri]|uniref:Uncharacterized protein n=1 Tax=Caenorhabditis brenneri TaxID=135651 RepID=G0PAR9_CAEBE|nr:hypothetical protein CAEBREN_14223 [Caenorhabditis brenneri]